MPEPVEAARTRTFTEGPVFDAAGNLFFTSNEGSGRIRQRWKTGLYGTSNLVFGGPRMDSLFVTGSVGHRAKSEGRVVRIDIPGARGRA